MSVFVVGDTTFDWSNSNQSGTLTYTGVALASPTISGTIADTSAATHSGAQTFSGTLTLASTALSVTNGQAITVAAGSYVLSGIGGANDTTNTVTLVAPTAAGQILYLAMATATTNLVTIADSTTVAASGAILLDANDTALFIAVDASTWALVSESDN